MVRFKVSKLIKIRKIKIDQIILVVLVVERLVEIFKICQLF